MSSELNVRSVFLEALEGRRLLSFSPAVSYPTIGTPSAIVKADFNNDGKLDLATCANAGTGSVSVLLGNGAGGFGAAQRIIVGSQLTSMAVADFNLDGNVDIVVADSAYAVLHLMKGNGDGTFQPAIARQQWNLLEAVTWGHFNNDNNPDLLVNLWDWDFGSSIYQVQLGDGQGGFADSPADPSTLDVHEPYFGGRMATGDFDGDGRLDMVNADVDVFRGDGAGTLQNGGHFPAFGWAAATGDLDGDGKADVISVGSNRLGVLRGRGDGTFDAAIPHTAYGTDHMAVATTDFNADGKLDAIVTDGDLGTVSVMLGNGDGTLRFFGAFATGTLPSGVVVGDFNGDGRPDAVVSNSGFDSRTASVLLNDGDWQTQPPLPPTPEVSISDVTVTEGDTGTQNATFTLTLSRPATMASSVEFVTGDITAAAGSDYVHDFESVHFAIGETTRTVTVAVKGDLMAEPNETFAATLYSAVNLRIADAQGIGTIIDNDSVPKFVVSDVSRAEGNAGSTPFTFTVSLTVPSAQAVQVNYATAAGSASNSGGNRDFLSTSGTLQFPAGVTSRAVTVSVVGDTRAEPDETFFVNLSQPVGAAIADGQAIGTIINDDSGRGKRWAGPVTGGDWSVPENWVPAGVPGTDSLVTISGAAVTTSVSTSISELWLADGANLSVAQHGSRVFRTNGLFLDAATVLDIADNALVIDYLTDSPLPTVRASLTSGHAGGAWNGSGIASSTAAQEPGTGVSFAEASELFTSFPATFAGTGIDATSVLLRHTLLGDANADLAVHLGDFASLATNFNRSSETCAGGNFDYDPRGDVNLGDFALLATNFNRTIARVATGEVRPALVSPHRTPMHGGQQTSGWQGLWSRLSVGD